MKRVILFMVCVFFTHTTFSQTVTVHDIKPLPSNITYEYVDGSVDRHRIQINKHRKEVNVYINGRYAFTHNTKELIGYCEKLLYFTTPNKGMIIQIDSNTMIGRINERLDVISIRFTSDSGEVFPMVMGVDRLAAIYQALKEL